MLNNQHVSAYKTTNNYIMFKCLNNNEMYETRVRRKIPAK